MPFTGVISYGREIIFLRRLRTGSAQVTGEIIQQPEELNRGFTYFSPTVRFTMLAGELVEAELAGSFPRNCCATRISSWQAIFLGWRPQTNRC